VIADSRVLPELRGALHNVARVYGQDGEVGLRLIHGPRNAEFVRGVTEGWSGVRYEESGDLSLADYNRLLTSSALWESIPSEFALVFQADSHLFKPIPSEFFAYDYVGAPWRSARGNGCGNGGFSLRRVAAMRRICRRAGPWLGAEDLFYARQPDLQTCPRDLQRTFSVEQLWYPDPVGCHQPYWSVPEGLYDAFLARIAAP